MLTQFKNGKVVVDAILSTQLGQLHAYVHLKTHLPDLLQAHWQQSAWSLSKEHASDCEWNSVEIQIMVNTQNATMTELLATYNEHEKQKCTF